MAHAEWQVYVVNEVRDLLDTLDSTANSRVVQAIDTFADSGPGWAAPSSTPSTNHPSPT